MKTHGAALFGISVLLSANAIAQSLLPGQPLPDRGVVPARTFDINGIENISIESGNLLLTIPLASLPPGPGGSGFSLGITYNSEAIEVSGPSASIPPDGGWAYNFGYSLNPVTTSPLLTPAPACLRPFGLAVQFPDGSQHPLALNVPGDRGTGAFFGSPAYYDINPETGTRSSQPCSTATPPNPLIYYTVDGTSARVELTTPPAGTSNPPTWILYLPNGSRGQFLCQRRISYHSKQRWRTNLYPDVQ